MTSQVQGHDAEGKAKVGRPRDRRWERLNPFLIPAVVAILIAFPLVVSNGYIVHLAIMIGIYSILTLSINVVTGYTGQLSLGHAAFYGIGAYTSALLALRLSWPFLLTFPAAGVVAGVSGLIVGMPSLKASGFYLGMITLGFGEIARLVMLNWQSVTRGAMGLVGIPAPSFFGYEFSSLAPQFYLVTAMVAVTAWAVKALFASRHGQAMIAIREDEVAARAMGIDTGRYKLAAFGISAFFAGLAGALFAHYISFIGASNFTSSESFLMLSMAILGGCSIPGSLLGAGVFVLLPEMLRSLADYRLFINGLLLVLFMIFRPGGLIPEPRLSPRQLSRWLSGSWSSGTSPAAGQGW